VSYSDVEQHYFTLFPFRVPRQEPRSIFSSRSGAFPPFARCSLYVGIRYRTDARIALQKPDGNMKPLKLFAPPPQSCGQRRPSHVRALSRKERSLAVSRLPFLHTGKYERGSQFLSISLIERESTRSARRKRRGLALRLSLASKERRRRSSRRGLYKKEPAKSFRRSLAFLPPPRRYGGSSQDRGGGVGGP